MDASHPASHLSAPAAWTLLGIGVVSASAGVIAQPGFSVGSMMLAIVLLVVGRVIGEMGLVVLVERATGLGTVVWELLDATRLGGWVGRRMADRTFCLLAGIGSYLLAITASQGVGMGNLSPLSIALSLVGCAFYILWNGIGERLAKLHVDPPAPASDIREV